MIVNYLLSQIEKNKTLNIKQNQNNNLLVNKINIKILFFK